MVKKYFENIVLIIMLISLFKGCHDSRQIKNSIQEIKDSTYTKTEMEKLIKIEGLKTEKRMIQSTDRKMLDVQRQSEIDNELNKLGGK